MNYFHRFILLLSLLFCQFSLASQVTPVIRCLISEESKIHSSTLNGPLYKLNQKILSELIGQNTLKFSEISIKRICNHPYFSPSLAFLQQLLVYKNKVFASMIYDPTDPEDVLRENSRSSLLEVTPNLLFEYLSDLQGIVDDPHCLSKNLRHLFTFYEVYKHLQTEQEIERLLPPRKDIIEIFNDLKKFDSIYVRCQAKPKKN